MVMIILLLCCLGCGIASNRAYIRKSRKHEITILEIIKPSCPAWE